MLLRVDQKHKIKKLDLYKKFLRDQDLKEIEDLSQGLKGLRVAHLNATPKGGGVTEILKHLVPLMRGVGLDPAWYIMPPNPQFFAITKQIHNALQGKNYELSFQEKRYYIEYNQKVAGWMQDIEADIFVIHDPQPAAVIDFLKKDGKKFISRIHIDSSSPNPEVWRFIKQFLEKYHKVVFSISDFVPKDFDKNKVKIFPPAIAPFSSKNRPIRCSSAKTILEGLGIDTSRPLVTQVSRFDPWKDPVGVVEAYRIARKEIPGLQLALVGLFLAQDDPEAASILNQVKDRVGDDPNVYLFYDLSQIGPLKVDTFVNVFQTASDVILQKSIKEGFGLTVTEAMWKRKPVIGGNAGGIKIQIEDGKSGYLVNSVEEAANRVIKLLKNSDLRKKMGREARERVKENFLLPRLLRDDLRLFTELI